MAERSFNAFGNPVVAGLLALMVLALAGAGASVWFGNERQRGVQNWAAGAQRVATLAQEVAKHGAAAAGGTQMALAALSQARSETDTALAALRDGDARRGIPRATPAVAADLGALQDGWDGMRAHIDRLLANGETQQSLNDLASDITITMSAIQQQNGTLVRSLLTTSAAAGDVVLAQRQAELIERMSRSIDRAVGAGDGSGLAESFQRNSALFRSIQDGLLNGKRDSNLTLTAVTDEKALASLNRMDELFRTVTSRVSEVQALSEELTRVKASADQLYAASQGIPALATRAAESVLKPALASPTSPFVPIGLAGLALVLFFVTLALVIRQARRNMGASTVENEQNQAAILQLLDELAALADGDLTVQATVTESFTGAIADSINFTIDQLRALVSKINETTGQVSTAADVTRSSVGTLSKASEQQSQEISDVSTAVSEMAVSIDQVSYNAAESFSVAERSVEIASKGVSTVQNTIGGMDKIRGQIQETAKRIKRLGESSQEIGDIVLLINDIADQTNILSLNAAIQASMAGDAGKGFAVVADEVQRLAERSGAAAKQISALVKTIQGDTNEAVSSMEQTTAEVVQGTRLTQEAGVALEEIEGVSKSLAEIIENISDAARQQAASAGKISNTMNSIQEITSQTTEGTRSTANSVGELAEITNELQLSVTGFKLPGA